MGTPGLQVSDIIKLVDNSIRFVFKLRQAPEEIQSILDSVEHANALLKALEQRQQTYGDEIETAHITKSAVEKYKAVIAKLEIFIKKHSRLTEGQFRGRLYWVTNEHFRNDRETLEKDLQRVEDRIAQAINLNTSTQLYRVERSHTLVHSSDQRVVHPPIRQSPVLSTNHADWGTEERHTEGSYSRSLLAESLHPTPTIANLQDTSGLYRTYTDLSEASSEATRQSSIFTSVSSAASIRTSTTSISQCSPNSSPPGWGNVQGMSNWRWNRHSIAEVDEAMVPNQPSIEEAATLASQPHRTSSGYSLPAQPHSASSGYSLPAQPQSPPHVTPITLSPPAVDRMDIKGKVKVYYLCEEIYQGKKRLVRSGHTATIIDIVRQESYGATEIRIMTDTRRTIFHRGPRENPDISQAIRRNRVSKDFAVSHPQIQVQLIASGKHTLFTRKKDGSTKILFTGSPEYTFTDERDNREFQSKIRGQTLVSEDEIVSIVSTYDKRALSENRYLQLWGQIHPRKVRYFCNVDGRNEFEEHDISGPLPCTSGDLKLKKSGKSIGKKNVRESDRGIEIGLTPHSGDDRFRNIRVLFPSATQKEKWVRKAQNEWMPD